MRYLFDQIIMVVAPYLRLHRPYAFGFQASIFLGSMGLLLISSPAQGQADLVQDPVKEQVSVSTAPTVPQIVPGERLSDWLLKERITKDSPEEQPTPQGNAQSPYYLGSSWLTRTEITDQTNAKQRLLESLETIAFPADDASAQQAKNRLRHLIELMPISGRVVLPNTNPRLLQANPKLDPILASGDTVLVPKTPQSVTVIRMNGTLCQVAYRAHVEARFYVQGCALKGAQAESWPDWAWVVEPNGSVHQVPVAAWNAAPQDYPAPGAWIWSPPRNSRWSTSQGEQFSDHFAQFLGTQAPSGLSDSIGQEQTHTGYLPRVGPQVIYESSRNLPISNNVWGETGLMQVPSARIAPAGTGSATLALWQPYGTLSLGFAPLDWFEFALRYTNINNVPYGSQALAGGQSYKDKSAGVKLRLWEESAYIPQLALGLRDITGTGLFTSEYAVASKRYNDFDFTLGLGWGELGTRNNVPNPFKVFGSSFGTYVPPTVGNGGTISTGTYFHGTSALIGGVQYHTPWDPLVLKLELDGNSYRQTPQPDLPFGQTLATKTMFNFGAVYQGSFWDLMVGLRGGEQVMMSLSFHDRIDQLSMPKIAQAPPLAVSLKPVGAYDPAVPIVTAPVNSSAGSVIANSNQNLSDRAIKEQEMRRRLSQGAVSPILTATNLDEPLMAPDNQSTASLRDTQTAGQAYTQTLVDFEAQTQWHVAKLSAQGKTWILTLSDASGIFIRSRLNRGIAVLHRDAPSQIEYFEIRMNNWGMLVSQYQIKRKDWMLSQTQLLPPSQRHTTIDSQEPVTYTLPLTDQNITVQAGLANGGTQSLGQTMASLDHDPLQTNLGVSYAQIVGGPNTPLLFSLGAKGDALYKFRDNTWISGTVNARVIDNFGKYTYQPPPDGLQPVRTDLRQYMTTSDVTMPNLQLTNTGQLGPNQFVSAYAGYLEMMFAGVGGEYLWRPVNSPIAIGANINRVYQRQFNQWTSLQSYSVNTGFVTAYWDTGMQDILVKLSAGQYLAGDRGATLDLSRVFQNGVKIGAYATRTNVSYAAFGEGSFDKGLYIAIPFDAFFARSSDSVANLLFTPLIRDGGAMLMRKYQLYDMTRTRDDRALSFGPD